MKKILSIPRPFDGEVIVAVINPSAEISSVGGLNHKNFDVGMPLQFGPEKSLR